MTVLTVAVTCTASDQNGPAVAGARYRAKLDRTEIYNGFVVPEVVDGIADANGVCVLQLWPNALGVAGSLYDITAINPDTGKKFLNTTISVPNSACNLHQILVQEPYPAIDAAQQALIAAQGALASVTAQTGIATTQATVATDARVASELALMASLGHAQDAALSEFNAAASENAALAAQADIHNNWQAKLDTADSKATIATTKAVESSASAAASLASQAAAELARDVSLIQAGVYVSEPAGRAAVADGIAFKVQGAGSVAAYEYRRVDANSSVLLTSYPSMVAYESLHLNQITQATGLTALQALMVQYHGFA
jgi:hypothetical protein